MCDPTISGIDYLLNFEFLNAFACTYANVAGLLVVGLLVYGAISLSIYIRTGSVVIPFVLLLTTGGATLTQIATPGIAAATVVVLCTGAGAITFLYYRYSR